MADLIGQKFIFAVAQQPFESQGDGNVRNMFGTLVPLISADGDVAEADDFPNSGLVWWQVLAGVRQLAVPGRLVKATLQHALRYDDRDPQSKFYQVHRESVASVDATDVAEVIEVEDQAVTELHHLVGPEPVARRSRPCATTVMVRWRGEVIGPFKATSEGEGVVYEVTLSTHRMDKTVTVLSEADFKGLAGSALVSCSAEVSLESQDRARANTILPCKYTLLMPGGLQRATHRELPRKTLETDTEIIRRVAKQLLSKRDRQETVAALNKLTDVARQTPDSLKADELRVLSAAQKHHESTQAALDEIARALLANDIIESRLSKAIEEATQNHLDRNASKLTAEVNQRVAEQQARLEDLRREADAMAGRLDADERQRRAAVQKDLEEQRRIQEAEIQAAREQFESEQARRAETHELLQAAVSELKDARGAIVSSVLTTLSVLKETAPTPSPQPKQEERTRERVSLPQQRVLSEADLEGEPDERRFFERFVQLTERRGFRFRELDLLRFHLSVKCGDISILSGPSGIGKSSLPRLYSEALAGRSGELGHRYLEVAVSPAWLDMRDLIGYVNTLDRRFQPAESGMFLHLAHAQGEWEERGSNSVLTTVCLDEMNLAQVEHYFSGILQAVERPVGKREVSCFASESVSEDDPLRRWAKLNLPATIRFVGTVNMDETTKQLSLRLLDRANLIELRPPQGNAFSSDTSTGQFVDGAPVLQSNYQSWLRPPVLPTAVAELLDTVHQELAELGAPVSPRRQLAVATFIASSPSSLCRPETALDCQIVQRLLPQVRGNVLEEGVEGLRRLSALFEPREELFPETVQALSRLVSQALDDGRFS